MTTETRGQVETASSLPREVRDGRRLVAKGDASGAEQLLTGFISAGNAPFEAYALQSSLQYRLGRSDEALKTAKAAVEVFPDNPLAHAALADGLMATDCVEDAHKALSRARTLFPQNAGIHLLYAETCVLLNAKADARGAFALFQDLGNPSQYLSSQIVVFSALGEETEAKRALRNLIGGAPNELNAIRVVRRALDRVDKLRNKKLALVLAILAQRILDSAPEPKVWRATYLLDLGNYRAALTVLNSISPEMLGNLPKKLAIEMAEIRAIACRELKDAEGVWQALEQLAELRPKNSLLLEALYSKSIRMGQDKAKIYEARLQANRTAKLPATLAQGLDALRAQPAEQTPPAIVEWAWDLSDQSALNFEDWKRQSDWGKRASVLMKHWWMYALDRSCEIEAFIDPPDPGEIDAVPDGSGCVVVSSHMGPVAAGVHFGVQSGRRFRVYGRAGAGPAARGGAPVRIGTGDRNATIRETVKELDSGTFIGFANDWRDPEGRSFQFLGREILLPLMAPRLVFSRRVPSLWWQPLWKGNRIIMEIARLPGPAEEEPFDEWITRWSAAYLGHLERVLRGAPENLNLGDGFWQNVSAEYAQGIRQRVLTAGAVVQMRERRIGQAPI